MKIRSHVLLGFFNRVFNSHVKFLTAVEKYRAVSDVYPEIRLAVHQADEALKGLTDLITKIRSEK